MVINQDTVTMDDSLNQFAKICKKIGHVEEQIENCKVDEYVDQIQGIYYEPTQIKLRQLKIKRADLENQKAKAEEVVYMALDHYYS
ncbi:hypothetical protein [Companilactobacillus farciminis]|uniref:hypothetical protein n=1 Tax=Companilactobacillus farciminis TaxID=1612 RepID=UPI00232E0972|nr:hypothetical protein [Companilactobacillus farciminis]WCG34778.1 hypothetical protein PML84_07845 [Companilactobacillus farciminis]